jgi:hypothetical protein
MPPDAGYAETSSATASNVNYGSEAKFSDEPTGHSDAESEE